MGVDNFLAGTVSKKSQIAAAQTHLSPKTIIEDSGHLKVNLPYP